MTISGFTLILFCFSNGHAFITNNTQRKRRPVVMIENVFVKVSHSVFDIFTEYGK